MPLYVTEQQVSELLTPADAIAAVEACFDRLARGVIDNPARVRAERARRPLRGHAVRRPRARLRGAEVVPVASRRHAVPRRAVLARACAARGGRRGRHARAAPNGGRVGRRREAPRPCRCAHARGDRLRPAGRLARRGTANGAALARACARPLPRRCAPRRVLPRARLRAGGLRPGGRRLRHRRHRDHGEGAGAARGVAPRRCVRLRGRGERRRAARELDDDVLGGRRSSARTRARRRSSRPAI